MKKVLILDGYNLIYRARYSGMNRGDFSTVFNFFRGLRPLVEKFSPDVCYFVLEGRPVKRLELDENYKGQRVYNDDDGFGAQKKLIIDFIKKYIPIKVARHKDYECDDVIHYLANLKHKDDKATIISSDTDFIQSINKNCELYNPVSKKFIEAFKYDYVSWKSLVGDKSDNIIGFKGIGNKRAISLLTDEKKFNDFLLVEENRIKFKKNSYMIAFHDLANDAQNITYTSPEVFDWDLLKKEFIKLEFNSIIGKEKTWNKYINTFNALERNLNNVYWTTIK